MKQTFEALVDQLMASGFFLQEAVEILEKTFISRSLERSKGNRSAASKVLGIHRNTLQRKMREYKMDAAPPRRKLVRKAKPAARARAAAS